MKIILGIMGIEDGGSNGTTVSIPSCINMNMADLLAQYFNNPMVVDIKFSNGSSVISGCNATVNHEKLPTNRVIKSCQEAQKSGTYILNHNENNITVYCDADYESGGWVVIQRRFLGTLDFYRTWAEYKRGFGNLEEEFWLGNDNIYQLTKDKPREIHFVMTDWDDRTAVAKYSSFQIGSEEQKYVLKSVGLYSGTAGDSFSKHLSYKFSTHDQDNDEHSQSCAVLYHGAWWYSSCHAANLNGKYVRGEVIEYATSMCWKAFMGYNYGLKTSKILVRI
ncbi:ficolin-1-like isoform X2 [Malaya genurostris]|nr:ficolin-1-like isoform X2 [Malaya genurostris]